jgi:transcriptional regulator with XRE-family HTH domain
MVRMTDVGERIRHYRQAQGWTISELAARADVDANRLAGMENGSAVPIQNECASLERALPGCSPQELGLLVYGETYRGFPGFDASLDRD